MPLTPSSQTQASPQLYIWAFVFELSVSQPLNGASYSDHTPQFLCEGAAESEQRGRVILSLGCLQKQGGPQNLKKPPQVGWIRRRLM